MQPMKNSIIIVLFVIPLYDVICGFKKEADDSKFQRLRDKAENAYYHQQKKAWARCASHPQSVHISAHKHVRDVPARQELSAPPTGRGRRAVSTSKSSDSAIFLSSSRGQLNIDEQKIPEHTFTVSFWCKPEGGQQSPAIILEADDSCLPFRNRGWVFGIKGHDDTVEQDLRFFFTLHVWSKHEPSTVLSPLRIQPRKWVHITITYDGELVLLYINGARVAISKDQASYSPPSRTCRMIWMGGNTNHHYRGQIADLRMWKSPLEAQNIRQIMVRKLPPSLPDPTLEDSLSSLNKWEWEGQRALDNYNPPRLIPSDVLSSPFAIQPSSNPCGLTICDSEEIARTYKDNWTLRRAKIMRYRVVIVTDSDGSNPTVTKDQIRAQHDYLNRAYMPHNITWELDEVIVRNSTLRRRSVLLNCYASMVGNGQCEPECSNPSTGNDGGDCGLPLPHKQNHLQYASDGGDSCTAELIGNNVCDNICNIANHEWDGGDCCSKASEINQPTCFDPSSPYRSYIDVKELKSMLQLKNTHHINVIFARWTNRDILGVATFPWEKNLLNELGGIVVQPSSYGIPGQMSTLVHELGHALGLWHVHRGVSELDCSHPCYEREATLYHGDLCSDTNPTPENIHCHDPPSRSHAPCGTARFVDTPYQNYMGYGDDSCVHSFTMDQVSRMHCYIDLAYDSVQNKGINANPPSPLLLSPVSSKASSVSLSWIPPLSTSAFYDTPSCTSCTENLEYFQYASKAEMNGTAMGVMWTPDEATGAPDADPCALSYKVWLPNMDDCPTGICTLTVHFETPVVPSLLQFWITWNAQGSISEIEVIFDDGSSDVISKISAQCDSPLTIPVFYMKFVSQIRIHVSSKFVGIDAIKMVSAPNDKHCSSCKPLKYRISRDPPFPFGRTKELDYPYFTDSNLHQKTPYTYKIQAWLGNHFSHYSPPLTFMVGSPICGDGKVDINESCDDGDVMNGDGCNSRCEVEESFNCVGEPSVCYWHKDDYKCEEFEITSSPSDCGFYTPEGFVDQWAYMIQAGPHELVASCPPSTVIGPPRLPLVCPKEGYHESSWSPCEYNFDGKFWLLVKFPKPVIATSVLLYLSLDGTSDIHESDEPSTIQLLDFTSKAHHTQNFEPSCHTMPQEIPILKDLSQPFVKTAAIKISFSSISFGISAVKLRSLTTLSPNDIYECKAGHLYHPHLQKCTDYCKLPSCPPLTIKHAYLNCTGYQEGDTCAAICHAGHTKQNKYLLTCLMGHWTGEEPSCKPVDCRTPLIVHGDAVCPDGTTFGKTCSYKCRPPARFIGGVNRLATITCEENGQWSRTKYLCQLSCPLPNTPPHAVLTSAECRNTDTLLFGQRCRFRCKTGYHVEGGNMKKNIFHLQCSQLGSWTGPKCAVIKCPEVDKHTFNCTSVNKIGSECRASCTGFLQADNPISMHKCGVDGKWYPPLQHCKHSRTCGEPSKFNNNIQFLCDGYSSGAICKASCNDPTEESMLFGKVEDRIKIRCTHNEQWDPNPEEIKCEKKCVLNYIGDGYCDAKNNREYCKWDGGDCCASTSLKNIVKPFPRDCGEACTCKDPNVIENTGPINK